MPKRKIVVSSSGGIGAGSPFALGGALFVEQVSPPFAFTQRLAALLDPEQSLIAPGPASHSFVMGEQAIGDADTYGDRSVIIGYRVQQTPSTIVGDNVDQILIGNSIVTPADATGSEGLVVIGVSTVFTTTSANNSFGRSVVIGIDQSLICTATTDDNAEDNVLIGNDSTATGGGSVGIGTAMAVAHESVAIGQASFADGQGVAIGLNSSANNEGVAIGEDARSGDHGVAVGAQGGNSGAQFSVSVGELATCVNDYSMALGYNAQNGLPANSCLIGGRAPAGFTTFYLGQGINDATGGVSYEWHTTDIYGGAGNNLPGNSLAIFAGSGTGDWANADNFGLDLRVGQLAAAGSTRQPYVSAIAMRHSDLNIAFWGGLGAAFNGGAQVFLLANAVTPPTGSVTTGVILYADAGQLFGLGASGVPVLLVS